MTRVAFIGSEIKNETHERKRGSALKNNSLTVKLERTRLPKEMRMKNRQLYEMSRNKLEKYANTL